MYKIVRLITIERRIGNLNRDAEIVNVDITNDTQCEQYVFTISWPMLLILAEA